MSSESSQGGRVCTRAVLFFALLAIGLSADLISKQVIFNRYFDVERERNREAQEVHYWVEGVLGIQTSTNGGALFGIGQGKSAWFAGLSILFLVLIFGWLFLAGGFRDFWLTLALGLVSGGILGNFYDRMGWGSPPEYPELIQYDVRDWILFRLEGVRFFDPWPNFNIADSLLVVGALVLLGHALWVRK